MVIGLINGVVSLITFKNNEPRKMGCGIYLLDSSITALLTVIIFSLNFWTLLLSQMNNVTHRSFLHFQCASFDFLLGISPSMDQWLNCWVAMERTVAVLKRANFDKAKSKTTVKYVIPGLGIMTICTATHDPIHRRLLDDINDGDDVRRNWRIASYSANIQRFNSAMNLLHFFTPFLINIISHMIIIFITARKRRTTRTDLTYREALREQFQQHKHILVAPIMLIILPMPRLIISFASGCMKSTNSTWLFLMGYFVSFTPPMLTFVVFVLPSKLYKKKFCNSIIGYRQQVRRRLRRSPNEA
jgi:hypothetical protein